MDNLDTTLQSIWGTTGESTQPKSAGEPLDAQLQKIYTTRAPQQATGEEIIPEAAPITQRFGNYNPKVEVMSKGRALGTNIGVPSGTPVSVPPGDWQVESTYTTAKGGYIGNAQNNGYGNAVKMRNTKTGEVLHFTHLSNVNVLPGQIIPGGEVVGASGATGNVTGPHLNLEYYNAQGQLGDVLNSPYGQYIPTQ